MRLVLVGAAFLVVVAGCDPSAPPGPGPATPTRPATPGPSSPAPLAVRTCSAAPDLGAGNARDVLFLDAGTGWVVTAHRVLATVDAGRRWTTSYRTAGRSALQAVDFVDRRHGWLVATDRLLRTTDGGRHWRRLPARCPRLDRIDFVTPRIGYAVAGDVLLRTGDSGARWHRVPAPPDVQSICAIGRRVAWLGAGGNIYHAAGSRTHWKLVADHLGGINAGSPLLGDIECTSGRSAWAVTSCRCGAMSQSPHIAYHLAARRARPIYVEPFFPHPRVHTRQSSPGTYPGPFAAVSARDAIFIDSCPACGKRLRGSHPRRVLTEGAPVAIARRAGRRLVRPGSVPGITAAAAVSFPTRTAGWVLATRRVWLPGPERARTSTRLVHTADGGRTWDVRLRI